MSIAELVVWSAMTGALCLLCLVAVADWGAQRSAAAARGVAFMVLTGSASVMMSGLPEVLFPRLDPTAVLPLKASLGPLSGALALNYLGVWLGAGRADPLTRWTVQLGSGALALVALGLAWAMNQPEHWTTRQVLITSWGVNLTSVALAVFVSLRGALFGDRLARWMVLACGCLGWMVLGLYAKGLAIEGAGIKTWVSTALATVAYFLIVIVLTIQRNWEVKRLRQLAEGVSARQLDIPMPQGSLLIPRVADAMWRSKRLERPCVVAALVVRNLYDLGDSVEHGVDTEILTVLAARIRRCVGFRNVVGLYHPRCFVLAVSPGQDPRRGDLLVESLLQSVRERVRVGLMDQRFDFWPVVGLGVVDVTHSPLEALAAINLAEHLALEDCSREDQPSLL